MRLIIASLFAAALTLCAPAALAGPDGATVFAARCKACHDPAVGRAPDRANLALRTRSDVVVALTKGLMVPMAQGMSPEEIAAVAAYVGKPEAAPAPKSTVSAAAFPKMPSVPASADPMCASIPKLAPGASDWRSMGRDMGSSRFQPEPGLAAADVPRLKVKWAFSMSGGGQPTTMGDWLFITNRNGRFYALDAHSGCVRYEREGLASRAAPTLVPFAGAASGWAIIVAQSNRVVEALDAASGRTLWRVGPVHPSPVSILTASPVVHNGKVYVPISSLEEVYAADPHYPCCSFRGALAALDLTDGRLLWRTEVMDEPHRVLRTKADGTKVMGPAGGAIWGAPTLDAAHGQIIVVTGDSYTDAPTQGADAIAAIDLETGKVRWRTQATPGDNFILGCPPGSPSENCPTPVGPDVDFGAAPLLFDLGGGKSVIVAGQKSAMSYGLDPVDGKVLWKTRLGVGSALGGVEWGMAADPHAAYIPISDFIPLLHEVLGRKIEGQDIGPIPKAEPQPGLAAVDPATGRVLWKTASPKATCTMGRGRTWGDQPVPCIRGMSAAPGVIPGVVFEGSQDGWFRAFDARSGKIIWEDSTTSRTYKTLNGVPAQPGGGLDGMGPTIAGGMVYVMSGFDGASRVGGNGVNVLLAYSVDGK
jgi:polyvinyl alcohol dehydrogenase (cytochrome)